MFALSFAITASAAGHVEVKFPHNWITKSESLTVDHDTELIVSVYNQNTHVDVQYAVVNDLTGEKVAQGTVKHDDSELFELPVGKGTYHIEGESRRKDDYREIAFMSGKGSASLSVK